MNWRTYQQGALSNVRGLVTNVFETEGQFQTFWKNNMGDVAGKMPTGGVDWSREKLVMINLGPRPNTGYELAVTSIKRVRAGEILVTYRERLPIEGVRYPQVQISPWYIVRLDRLATGAIKFQGETVKGSIGGGVIIVPGRGGDPCCGPRDRCCGHCDCGCADR